MKYHGMCEIFNKSLKGVLLLTHSFLYYVSHIHKKNKKLKKKKLKKFKKTQHTIIRKKF